MRNRGRARYTLRMPAPPPHPIARRAVNPAQVMLNAPLAAATRARVYHQRTRVRPRERFLRIVAMVGALLVHLVFLFGFVLGPAFQVVLPPEQLSRVPRAPAALLGIMNLRGRVVPVVDLVHTLPEVIAGNVLEGRSDGSPGESLRDGRVLIMERGGHEVIGLLVRVVEGIAPLPASPSAGPVLLDPDKVIAAIDALVA